MRVMEVILLITAIAPVFAVGILCFFFFRAARRNDERERAGEL
jgi:hypothetical protein